MANAKHYDKLRDIRTDLSVAFISLMGLFHKEYPGAEQATGYIQIDLIEAKLNALKALEYHYRDNGVNGHVKSRYPSELKKALKLLEKYSENKDPKNVHSDLVLKEKFDGTGVIKQRNRLRK